MARADIRVRFAPSPTGIMHIGNSRTALLNYLFAKQKGGTNVLRIEDTDPSRNFDPGAKIIQADLNWLGLNPDEGPYYQSERQNLYQEKLKELIDKGLVYRCFCSEKELAQKRDRQRALKLPPRYDRTCADLSQQEIQKRLDQNVPFIWRFKLDHDKTITIIDLARGPITFQLKNFSDFPLTRADGSFTFMFANFVDDMTMKMTHVFRGEDHQSNTASQGALYEAFGAPLPIFWHMPMLSNVDGKKLSKRDFGFSLHDLRDAGYLPHAINNYLAISGGSYPNEIMDMDELIKTIDFDNPHSSGAIKYDVEKLRWVNHQWINRLSAQELAHAALPFLIAEYPQAQQMDLQKLAEILQILKTDLYTLKDVPAIVGFYFNAPQLSKADIEGCVLPEHRQALHSIISAHINEIDGTDAFLNSLKKEAKANTIPFKQLFWALRLALMGAVHGPGIAELITILGSQESSKRIEAMLNLLHA